MTFTFSLSHLGQAFYPAVAVGLSQGPNSLWRFSFESPLALFLLLYLRNNHIRHGLINGFEPNSSKRLEKKTIGLKFVLAFLLIFIPGCVWTCGNWRHPVKGPIEFDADRETCLLQISLKTGKDYSNCVYVYTPYCNGIVEECMEELGWVTIKR